MIEEREVVTQEPAAPRWIGIVVVALALVSFVGLGSRLGCVKSRESA